MMFSTLLLAGAALVGPDPGPPRSDLLAIRVGRAYTVNQGVLEHAVILVENGKIVQVGEDLPIERGIPILDRDPEWTVMPGLVNAYSRLGMDGDGGNDSAPGQLASGELFPESKDYARVLELGVTTLALYPPGNGIPGRAVAIRPKGERPADMVLAEDVYLKIRMRANSQMKRMVKKGFEEADKWKEKDAKDKEKWEKDKEKEDKKKSDDESKKDIGPYQAPEKNAEAAAFLALRAGELRALVGITDAADYVHFLDCIGEESFQWDIRVPITRELNLFYVQDLIGKAGRRVILEPVLTVHPNTMRQRNPAAELAAAGAKLVLIPRSDSVNGHREWLSNVGEMVAAGLPRDVALRAVTQEAADLIGLGARLGSIEPGKDANLIFFTSDPFEPDSEVKAVMLEGVFVTGEVNQ